jgi:hypothetical protein
MDSARAKTEKEKNLELINQIKYWERLNRRLARLLKEIGLLYE